MTAKPDNVTALIEAVEHAAERGAERGTVAALDRYLPHVAARAADDVGAADPAVRQQRIRRVLDGKRVVAWLDSEIGRRQVNEALGNRSTSTRWEAGKGAKPETLRQLLEHVERPDLLRLLEDDGYLRTLGDPSDLLDELPSAEPDRAENGGDGARRPTRAEIHAAGTPTKAQLAEWGIPWPPPRGWRKGLLAAAEPAGDADTGRVRDAPYEAGERHRCWPDWTWNGAAFVRAAAWERRTGQEVTAP